MSIDPKLVEILVCPVCRDKVDPVQDGAGLGCRGCRRVYPIRDGIPIMLVDEASSPGEKDPA